MRTIQVVVGIVMRGEEILISRRRVGDSFEGLWEFPGGKLESNETVMECLSRELREELGVTVQPVEALTPHHHTYPDCHVILVPIVCKIGPEQPQPLASSELRWVRVEELADYPFPAANAELIQAVIRNVGRAGQPG